MCVFSFKLYKNFSVMMMYVRSVDLGVLMIFFVLYCKVGDK